MEAWQTLYRLPVTTVTIAGTRTIADNPVNEPRESTTLVAEIAIEIQADADNPQHLRINPAELAKRSVSVGLKPDGRLTTISSAIEDHTAHRWKTALSVGASTFGAVAPITAPSMGPLGVALAAAAGVAAAAVSAQVSASDVATARELPAQRPPATDLGIHAHYVRAHPKQADLLADLRFSQAVLEIRRARAAHVSPGQPTRAISTELRDVAKALQVVQGGLDEAESRYRQWIAGLTTIKYQDRYHRVFTVDALPTEAVLRHAAENNFAPVGTNQGPGWLRLFENLRVAISVDLLGPSDPVPVVGRPSAEALAGTETTITYRQPQVARIVQWKIERGEDRAYRLEQLVAERKVVVVPGTERCLPLMQEGGKRTIGALFDEDGLLVEVIDEHLDSRTQRFQELREAPAIIAGGLESGERLSKGWSSVTDDVLGPRDPLEEIREELEEAELRARLAKARVIISEPTRGLTLFVNRAQSKDDD